MAAQGILDRPRGPFRTVLHPWRRALLATVAFALTSFLPGAGQGDAEQGQSTPPPQHAATALRPMVADAHPTFEVATIRPSDPNDGHFGFQLRDRKLVIENRTVSDLIVFAYGVHAKQIVDAPAWTGSEHFDIQGVPDVEGVPNFKQYREMVQKLLQDRFQLRFHRDQREMPRYVVTVAKGGPRLEATKSAPDAQNDETGSGSGEGRNSWRFRAEPMPNFVHFLEAIVLDRPVVDQTELTGRYDFRLTWTGGAETAGSDQAPDFYTAIQEQTGLKVQPSRGPVEVLIIDHIEQPSPN